MLQGLAAAITAAVTIAAAVADAAVRSPSPQLPLLPQTFSPSLFCLLVVIQSRAGPQPASSTTDTTRRKEVADGQVLVRFKTGTAAASVASAQAEAPLPGLQLQRLVGDHHAMSVPTPGAGRASVASAGGGHRLPSDAIMLFTITDGSSVQAKVAELQAHPGVCVWRRPGGLPQVVPGGHSAKNCRWQAAAKMGCF